MRVVGTPTALTPTLSREGRERGIPLTPILSREERERGRPPEHMQAVADPHVFQLTEPSVQLQQRRIRLGSIGLAFPKQSRSACALENQIGDGARASRIERLRLRELVEQRFQLVRGAIGARLDERRGEMANRHSGDPAFGLRGFAGIVDDEGIDHGQRAEGRLDGAVLRKRDRLARQPFERAVRAQMNQRVDPLDLAQPDVERDIGVARRSCEIVIFVLARLAPAPIRLHRDDQLARAHEAENERAFAQGRIGLRVAPGRYDVSLEALWQDTEASRVVGQRNDRLLRPLREMRDQRLGLDRRVDVIAGVAQGLADRGDARGRVEADGITDTPAFGGIVGENAGEPPIMARFAPKLRPSCREIGDKGDAVLHRRMNDARELQVVVARARLLEGYRARQNAPVDFGQRDIHREVGGRKPARRGCPGLRPRARQHDLQHRRVGFVENAAAVLVEARRKGGGVEDDVELFAGDQLAQGRAYGGVLEARDVGAGYREAARFERIC